MSHLTALSLERVVYVLGELRLEEHLTCFRPAEHYWRSFTSSVCPLEPWLKSSLVLMGPDNLLFLLQLSWSVLVYEFYQDDKSYFGRWFKSSRAWTSLCSNYSECLCAQEECVSVCTCSVCEHLWNWGRARMRGRQLPSGSFPIPLSRGGSLTLGQSIPQSWVNSTQPTAQGKWLCLGGRLALLSVTEKW